MLTLYWDLISQPARAVKAVIDLGKLEAELINVDLLKGENKSPEYLSKNPHGKIPFLVHGDFKLAESNAILVYLCEAFPEKLSQYYGTTAQSKAIVNQHLAWAQTSFRPGAVGIIVLKFHGKIKAGKKLTTKELEDAEKKMHDGLKTLETTLAEGKTTFIAGDHLTIADLQIFHEVTNLLIYEIPFNNYTAITAWFNAVLAVPEARAIHDAF